MSAAALFPVDSGSMLQVALDQAILRLMAAPHQWGCRHILAGSKPIGLCEKHPTRGLFCLACADAHLEADPPVRHYDRCGTPLESHQVLITGMQATATDLVLESPTGDRRVYDGLVIVAGLGLCAPCGAEIVRPAIPTA
jgi:hypothetical protein